jgi:uncharacterized membrane protein AbrB (regulator of aidB expression)
VHWPLVLVLALVLVLVLVLVGWWSVRTTINHGTVPGRLYEFSAREL